MTRGTSGTVWADGTVVRRCARHIDPVLGPAARPSDSPDPSEINRLIGQLGAAGGGDALEILGDRLTEWLHRTESLRDRSDALREFASLAQIAYIESCVRGDGHMSRVGPKVMALGILRAKLAEPDRDDERPDRERDDLDPQAMADSVVDSLIPLLLGPALAPRPDGTALVYLGLLVPRLIDLASASVERNTHLARAVAEWVGRHVRHPLSSDRAPPPEALRTAAFALEARCERHMAEVEARLGLEPTALDAAEQAAYRATYRKYRTEEGRRLAHRCLEIGDRLLTSTDDTSDERCQLLDRLFKVSRLTGDVAVIMERSEQMQRHIRERGLRNERAGYWVEAANSYSNLAYRYFTAAEYTGTTRMYLLAVYFFDKAEVLRSRDPSDGYEPADHELDDQPERGYRTFESQGFMYGASARLAEPETAADLYDLAASAHEHASRLTFQSPALFSLYNTAGHFFNAHAALARCVRSPDVRTSLELVAEAALSLRACADVTQSVLPIYEAILARLASGKRDPCTVDMVKEVGRTLHPDGERVEKAASAAATALAAGDRHGFQGAVSQLSRLLVFLYPLG